MESIEVYQTYLAFKNHFSKETYDFFKYHGKVSASQAGFNKRKDKYFFERMSRKRSDPEVRNFFLANFSQSSDPSKLWIGEIIKTGEVIYKSWFDKQKTLVNTFRAESEVFLSHNFNNIFKIRGSSHPDILKKHIQGAISIETMVILDSILQFSHEYDEKLFDPVWETVSLKIRKYKPFLNIDVKDYKRILRETVCE
jgi:hypothetical protein